MTPKTILIRINLAVALVVAGTLLAQAQESLFGTWKTNAAKSKYSPGPAPKSNIAKWEPFQGGVKLTVDVVPAKGETQHYESSGKFDGKDNPVKGNNPDGDAIAFSKIDTCTYEAVTKKGGKTTLTSRIVVAADGKTRITTQTGKNSQGRDRQHYDVLREAVTHTILIEGGRGELVERRDDGVLTSAATMLAERRGKA